MKKRGFLVFLISLAVLLSINFVSAGILGDVNDFMKSLFGIGDNSGLQGELYQVSGDEGPVAYWKFDGDAKDSIGLNHGTLNGATLTEGISGQAYDFDAGDYISAPLLDVFEDELTFSVWVKPETKSDERPVILGFDKYGFQKSLWIDASDNFVMAVTISGQRCSSRSPMEYGKWYYLVGTIDSTRQVKLYVDGELKDAQDCQPWLIDKYGNTFRMGYYGSVAKFDGIMDEVKIWDYALSESEIKAEYDSYNTLNCVKCPDFNKDGVVDNNDETDFVSCVYHSQNCKTDYDLDGDGSYTISGDVPCFTKDIGKNISEIEVCEIETICVLKDCIGNDFMVLNCSEDYSKGRITEQEMENCKGLFEYSCFKEPNILGDLNSDDHVNIKDLNILKAIWALNPDYNNANKKMICADINKNNSIDDFDVLDLTEILSKCPKDTETGVGDCVYESNKTQCTDSDDGADYYVRGTTTGPSMSYTDNRQVSKTDFCVVGGASDGKLMEYVCENGYVKDLDVQAITCANVCKEGVCVPAAFKEVDMCEALNLKAKEKVFELANKNETIHLKEGEDMHYRDYFVLDDKIGGVVLEINSINNATTGFFNDYLRFKNAVTDVIYEVSWISEGEGDLTINGQNYRVNLKGSSQSANQDYIVNVNDLNSQINTFYCDWSVVNKASCGNNICEFGEFVYLNSEEFEKEVVVGGKTYSVQLVSAGDTSATIRVNEETREINEDSTKIIDGIYVSLRYADETNLELYAELFIGENAKLCQQDCLNTEACPDFINKILNPTDFYSGGVEYTKGWESYWGGIWWIKGVEYPYQEYSASWHNYHENNRNYVSYHVLIFDDKNIDLQSWLESQTQNRICDIQSYWSQDNQDNLVYICNWDVLNNKQDLNQYQGKSRQILWINKNIAIRADVQTGEYLSDEEFLKLSQERFNGFFEDIKDNRDEYIGWEYFGIDWPLSYQIADSLAECGSEIKQETCNPCWNCKIEPVICPQHGYQTRICKDNCCDKQREEEFQCSPGICSGCMVSRWMGYSYSDNICVPYGTRLAQLRGEKDEEIPEGEDLDSKGNIEYKLEILDDYKAYFLFNGPTGTIFAGNLYEGNMYELDMSEYEGMKLKFRVEDVVPSKASETGEGYVKIILFENFDAYCNYDGKIMKQKGPLNDGTWNSCQNNYECESNFCSSGECIEVNRMIENVASYKVIVIKIICKLANLFNLEGYNECVSKRLGQEYIESVPEPIIPEPTSGGASGGGRGGGGSVPVPEEPTSGGASGGGGSSGSFGGGASGGSSPA